MKLKRYFIVWIGVSLMLLTVLLTLFTTMADDGMVWDYQFLFEQVVKHFVTMIFPMCITLISGYMISREYTDDTLKNIETLPISFRKLLAGKLIVSAILSLFLGIVCFVFTVIANFIMGYLRDPMHQSDLLHRGRESGSRCHPRFWQNSLGARIDSNDTILRGEILQLVLENLTRKGQAGNEDQRFTFAMRKPPNKTYKSNWLV